MLKRTLLLLLLSIMLFVLANTVAHASASGSMPAVVPTDSTVTDNYKVLSW